MNWPLIRTLIQRDLTLVTRSRMVLLPLILLPLLLMILLPAVGASLIANIDPESETLEEMTADLDSFFENLPPSMTEELDSLETEPQRLIYIFFVYLFAPLYLIMPLMVANVIAADSFVGEKERKTLEALLYTPSTDRELYVAKLLAPWIAALIVGLVTFVVYAVVLNLAAWPAMERVFFPTLTWVLLAVWVGPAAAGLGLGAMVIVSSRTNTFQEAYQFGGIVVLPLLLLIFGQIAGVLYLSAPVVLLVGGILWVIDGLMLWSGMRGFSRSALLSRL